MQAAQIDRAIAVAAEILGHQLAGFDQLLDRLRRKLRVHLESRAELMLEVAEGRKDVPFFGHPLEQEDHRGARALDRIFGDAEFLGYHVGGAKPDAGDGACEHVGVAAHRLERVAPVHLVDAPRVAGGDPVAAQKNRELAQTRGIAPRHRDSRCDHRAQAVHLAQALGRLVEHGRQRLAEVLGDPPRERGPDAFYLAGEIALERGHRGRTDGVEILDPELLAVLRMALEAAAQTQTRTDVEPGQAADHGDAPAQDFVAAFEHRDRVATLLVDVEQLVQRALDQEFNLLARFRHLPHPLGGRDVLRPRQEELLAEPSASSERLRGYQESPV